MIKLQRFLKIFCHLSFALNCLFNISVLLENVCMEPSGSIKYHEDGEQNYFRDHNVSENDLRFIIMDGFGISESC